MIYLRSQLKTTSSRIQWLKTKRIKSSRRRHYSVNKMIYSPGLTKERELILKENSLWIYKICLFSCYFVDIVSSTLVRWWMGSVRNSISSWIPTAQRSYKWVSSKIWISKKCQKLCVVCHNTRNYLENTTCTWNSLKIAGRYSKRKT